MAEDKEVEPPNKELSIIPEPIDVGKSELEIREGAMRRDSGEDDEPTAEEVPQATLNKFTKWRNIIGFLILGLCNNFPYVIMLSAALDIIKCLDDPDAGGGNCDAPSNNTQCDRLPDGSFPGRQRCEIEGTSLILLADIVPTVLLKLFAPYVMNFVPYWIRVSLASSFSLTSFILVGLSLNRPLVIFGVVCASISSGFGELTFLSLTARYDKSTVSGWSSGTGFAGVGGALIYAGLRTFLSSAVTLYIQTVVPLLMMVTFIFVLGKPGKIVPPSSTNQRINERLEDEPPPMNGKPFEETAPLINEQEEDGLGSGVIKKPKLKLFNKEELTYWWSHMKYIPRLWKYMLPLFVVYVAEYMINQSLFEQLYNPGTFVFGKKCLNQDDQYRWLQVIYQFGVLISRSSVSLIHIKHFWVLAVLQAVNFVFFFFAACYLFIPSFWITFLLVLYEGLLGGGVYVNAFYAISKNVPKIHREFSMGVASVADSSGIFLAAVLSEWVIHTYICDHFAHYVEYYMY